MSHQGLLITAAKEKLALEYKLSQQEALLLALLVYNDMMTKTKLTQAFGAISTSNLVARLRTRLGSGVPVQTIHGWGYCLEQSVRVRLIQGMGEANVITTEGANLSSDAL